MKDELLSIKGLGKVALSKLKLTGINTLKDLAEADPESLANETGISVIKIKGWQVEARNLLGIREKESFPGIDELVEELSKKDKEEPPPESSASIDSILKTAQEIDSTLNAFQEKIIKEEPVFTPEEKETKPSETDKEPELSSAMEETETPPPPPDTSIPETAEVFSEEIGEGPAAAEVLSTKDLTETTEEELEVIDLTKQEPKRKTPKYIRPQPEVKETPTRKTTTILITAFLLILIILSAIWLIFPAYRNYTYTSKAITAIFQKNEAKFTDYIAKIRPTYKSLIQLSLAFMANKYYERADKFLKQAEKLKSEDPTPNLLLAELYLKTNNYGAAYMQALEARKKDIKNPELLRVFGLYYLKIGDLANAREKLEEYLKLKPKSATGHLNYAKVLIKLNDTKNAIKHLNLSLEYTKSDLISSAILEELGDVYVRMQNYIKAESPYKKALTQNPNNINLMYKLANVYYNTGKINSALSLLKQIVRINPNYYPANVLFGKIYYKRQDYSRAKKYFLEVIKNDYNNPDAIWHLSIIYYKEGDFVNAEIFLKKSIIIGIDEPRFYYYLAYINYQNQNYQRALNYLKQAEEHFTNNYIFYYFYAHLSFLLHDIDEAFNTYKFCLSLKSDDGTVYNNLGVLSELKKQYADAETYYFNAMELLTPKGIVNPVKLKELSTSKNSQAYLASIARQNYYRVINRQYLKSYNEALKHILFIPSKEITD